MKLFSKLNANRKIAKSNKAGKGYLTTILHLAPANRSGYEVCRFASPGCRASCLNTSGHGRYNKTQQARVNRTKMLFENRETFIWQLLREIRNFVIYCEKRGVKPAIRLNGTSDISWEKICPAMFSLFPQVQFYDYTKNPNRIGKVPANYHLTFSKSENNLTDCFYALHKGVPVAVVFSHSKPKTWLGVKTENGDKNDLRFLNKGVIALSPKGRGRYDKSGFVIKTRKSH